LSATKPTPLAISSAAPSSADGSHSSGGHFAFSATSPRIHSKNGVQSFSPRSAVYSKWQCPLTSAGIRIASPKSSASLSKRLLRGRTAAIRPFSTMTSPSGIGSLLMGSTQRARRIIALHSTLATSGQG
jgi:hypothetical protein